MELKNVKYQRAVNKLQTLQPTDYSSSPLQFHDALWWITGWHFDSSCRSPPSSALPWARIQSPVVPPSTRASNMVTHWESAIVSEQEYWYDISQLQYILPGTYTSLGLFQGRCRSLQCGKVLPNTLQIHGLPKKSKKNLNFVTTVQLQSTQIGECFRYFQKKDWVVEWFNALVTTFVAPSACSDSAWQQVRTFMLRSAHVWPFAFLDAERPKGTMLSCPAPGILSYSHGYATASSRRILWSRSK